ncbi:TIGR04219 family outer membrane beta-barrel protein [Shewanella sp. AS16]|uniref:TIGR04219 family outer membrane beta-barrel protein n=1 Tax=Shewanella sp. AS16 TaxID=2907625 RepID=UPI001F3D1BB7|nr:TIGR04219 family outer membrane beta-barrel protein [Shewanella sp. AS16]MCE9687050.1 TIGR04219 family outer membrane beta-barrel protein [Shewanella sp. AS16]
MKKTFLAAALLSSFAATSIQAATLVGFKVGGDYWHADASGSFSADNGQQQEFAYDSSAQGSVWIAVEHPLPFIPNAMIRENRVEEKGLMSGADFMFNGDSFTGDVRANTDLSNTDFVLYYELLDNDLVSLDLGAAYKLMHGAIRVENSHPQEKDIDSGVTMGYASAKVGIPGMGLYGFADVLSGLNESSVYDYAVGLGWEFDGLALDYRVRAGYRDFNFDVNGFSGISANMKFDGYFAGLEIAF